jgi:hypothetical protein
MQIEELEKLLSRATIQRGGRIPDANRSPDVFDIRKADHARQVRQGELQRMPDGAAAGGARSSHGQLYHGPWIITLMSWPQIRRRSGWTHRHNGQDLKERGLLGYAGHCGKRVWPHAGHQSWRFPPVTMAGITISTASPFYWQASRLAVYGKTEFYFKAAENRSTCDLQATILHLLGLDRN